MVWGIDVRLAALVAVACAAAPVAAAQDPERCDLYKQMIAEAPSGFTAYRGEPIPGRPDAFMSTINPPGFTCMVADAPTKAYICYMMSRTKGSAEIGYILETAMIQRCFPGWASRPPAAIEMEGDPITEESIQFYSQIGNVEVSIGVIRAHLDVPEPAPRVLGFVLNWQPLPVGV